jgi:hypothetical protein
MTADQSSVVVGLNAVIVAVTDKRPRVLTVRPTSPADRMAGDLHGLPFGPLDPQGDRTLELGLRRWVGEQTGINLGYVEQLYTFGDRDREPVGPGARQRVLSVGYLALVKEGALAGEARWRDCYAFLPWEDWRLGKPDLIDRTIQPALQQWIDVCREAGERQSRQDRVAIAFGWDGAPWDGERVLERYELLYEAGLVYESWFDRRARQGATTVDSTSAGSAAQQVPGLAMRLDHRRILATALGRLRGKLRYRPVVFELLPDRFTLLQLQQCVEALAGVLLHKQNFRRLVERGGLVEGTGKMDLETGGRPAEIFRFRREVLRERPAPGVGLPSLRESSS